MERTEGRLTIRLRMNGINNFPFISRIAMVTKTCLRQDSTQQGIIINEGNKGKLVTLVEIEGL